MAANQTAVGDGPTRYGLRCASLTSAAYQWQQLQVHLPDWMVTTVLLQPKQPCHQVAEPVTPACRHAHITLHI